MVEEAWRPIACLPAAFQSAASLSNVARSLFAGHQTPEALVMDH